jgi:hypothetical protein
VIYDDDDPWNQTAADNAEWLIRFKRDVGLAPADEGPGLPPFDSPRPWTVKEGGSGFSPPYVMPKAGQDLGFPGDVPVRVDHRMYKVRKETAGQYLRDLNAGRYAAPATVFCSRDLENGLNTFVQSCIANRHIPSDDELRAKARDILGVDHTAAEDPKLLESFKAMHALWRPRADGEEAGITSGPQPDYSLPNFTREVDMFAAFDQHMDPTDLSTDFSAGLGGSVDRSASGEGSGMGDLDAQMEFEKLMCASSVKASPL